MQRGSDIMMIDSRNARRCPTLETAINESYTGKEDHQRETVDRIGWAPVHSSWNMSTGEDGVMVAFSTYFSYVFVVFSQSTALSSGMLYEILLLVSIVYFLQIVIVALAVSQSHYPFDRSFQPYVSIVIAARNEETNIGRCLESISDLTYSRNHLEVIVVDDRSTDGTHRIVNEFCKEHPHFILITADPEEGRLRGKTNAITKGIEAAKGEILMFTDADCVAKRQWVEETVKYYEDPGIGIVAGFTLLRADNWFESIQALDWLTLFSVAAGVIKLGFPVTAVGNNLSVRRKAYDEVGGYRKIPFSVTEDYALFHAITSQTAFSARFPVDERVLVESRPCTTWKELYRQKTRWFTGGRDMDRKNLAIFGIAYLLNLLLIIAPMCCAVRAIWIPLILKVSADFLLLVPALSAFGRWKLMVHFFLFQIYFILYVVLFPLLVLFGSSVVWKERTFTEPHIETKQNAL
jgi:cellulose synthase/poly-beta-1,6-N-acetylglucosamine synthase-like glycosyltransferase